MGSFSTDWFFFIFFINLVIFAYVRMNFYGYIQQLLSSVISYGTSYKMYRDSKNVKPASGFLLIVISLFSVSVFFYQAVATFNPQIINEYGLIVYGSIIIFLIIVVLLNKIFNWFMGFVFFQEELSSEFNRNIDFFNQVTGILVFPISFLSVYSNIPVISIYIGFFIILTIYLLRIIRLMKINFNKQINIFYMFLYLCTVEFIPIVYLIKILTKP